MSKLAFPWKLSAAAVFTLFTYGSTITLTNAQLAGYLPFFDNINNPVSGLGFGGTADVTPQAPTLNSFDNAVLSVCGNPGKVVSRTEFQTLMNNNPTVLANIKNAAGGFLVAGRTTTAQFLADLTNVWFNVAGFDHVLCGEPAQGGSIGGLHFVGRFVQLQNAGLAGRLPNNTRNEQVVPGVIYSVGAIVRVGSGTSQSPVKSYGYTLSAEDILTKATVGYKNNPNTGGTNQSCILTVTDAGRTFRAVLVRRSGGVRTFYPTPTPSGTNCR